MKKTLELIGVPCCALALAVFAGCERNESPAPAAKAGDHSHEGDHDHDHDHDHAHADGGEMDKDHGHGETTQMGEQKAGAYTVKVSRDGDIKPGGDVPVDIWVDGGAKGKAVRFWFGTEDAKGSIKAKCEVEGDQWHTHGEVPDPLPEGSKLWIEIEGEDGTKTVVGFDI
jgi:hypothetical protein